MNVEGTNFNNFQHECFLRIVSYNPSLDVMPKKIYMWGLESFFLLLIPSTVWIIADLIFL